MRNIRTVIYVKRILLTVQLLSGICILCVPHQSWCQKTEHNTYEISYLGISVGHGTITVSDTIVDNRAMTLMTCTAQTHRPTSLLFHVNNAYHTCIDRERGHPVFYIKDIEQSNFTENTIIHFNEENGYVYCDSTLEFVVDNPVHNLFSTLFMVAGLLFKPAEIITLPVYAAGGLWQARIEAQRVEKVITPVESNPSTLIEITFRKKGNGTTPLRETDVLTNRLVNGERTLRLWVSSGPKRLLVQAEYDVYPGTIQMRLVSQDIKER